MDSLSIDCGDPARLGRALRTWRGLRRVKQDHAAELLGVSQTTVSRWENGRQTPAPEEQWAIRRLMQARLDGAAERELARLVTQSARPLHLICDLTHRLLALSALREAEMKVGAAELLGRSFWPHASPGIVAAEAELAALGWFEPGAPAVEGVTRGHSTAAVRIRRSRFRWTRFQLSDGSFARLVETVARLAEAAPPGRSGRGGTKLRA